MLSKEFLKKLSKVLLRLLNSIKYIEVMELLNRIPTKFPNNFGLIYKTKIQIKFQLNLPKPHKPNSQRNYWKSIEGKCQRNCIQIFLNREVVYTVSNRITKFVFETYIFFQRYSRMNWRTFPKFPITLPYEKNIEFRLITKFHLLLDFLWRNVGYLCESSSAYILIPTNFRKRRMKSLIFYINKL